VASVNGAVWAVVGEETARTAATGEVTVRVVEVVAGVLVLVPGVRFAPIDELTCALLPAPVERAVSLALSLPLCPALVDLLGGVVVVVFDPVLAPLSVEVSELLVDEGVLPRSIEIAPVEFADVARFSEVEVVGAVEL